jgi:hypothetical protein
MLTFALIEGATPRHAKPTMAAPVSRCTAVDCRHPM